MDDPFTSFFQGYASAFDDFDAEQIASFYHCPCVLVSGDSVAALTTEKAILNNMQLLVANQRQQGCIRASASEFRVEYQAPNLAIVCVRWRIFKKDDELLWDWLNTYNLVKSGDCPRPHAKVGLPDDWRILVSTTHSSAE